MSSYAPKPILEAADELGLVLETFISNLGQFYRPTEQHQDMVLDWNKELADKKAALSQFKEDRLISPQQYAQLSGQIEDEYDDDVWRNEIATPKIVLKEHQGIGKTHETLKHCISRGRKFTYCSQDHDTLREKQMEAKSLMSDSDRIAETRLVRGEGKECEDLLGKNGEAAQQAALERKQSGIHHGLRKAITEQPDHEYATQCSLGNSICQYDQQFEDTDDIAGLYAHPKMLHRDELTEDRIVILDESAINYFITEVGDIRSAVRRFCSTVDMPEGLRTYGQLTDQDSFDAIQAFRKSGIDVREEWQEEEGYDIQYSRDSIREYLIQNPDWVDKVVDHPSLGHVAIGEVVYALLFSTDPVNGYHHKRIEQGHDLLVRPESAKILRVPDFSKAAAVIGLDATAREPIWDKFILPNADVLELRDNEERRDLAKACNLQITQVGDNAYHGDGGNLNAEYIKSIKRIADEINAPAATFGTKTYFDLDAVDYYFGLHDKAVNMGELDFLVLAMAPHPGDTTIEEIAAWFDIRLGPESRLREGTELEYVNDGMNSEDKQIVDDIFSYFREDKIEQAIFRGLRPHESGHTGLHVLTLTACLPDWMPVSEEIEAPTQRIAVQERYIAKAMQALEEPTLSRIQNYIADEFDAVVTQQRVHQFKERYDEILDIEKWEEDGRAYVYILRKLPDIAKDSVEQISNSIEDVEFVPDSGAVNRVSNWVASINESAMKIKELARWLLRMVPRLESEVLKTTGIG